MKDLVTAISDQDGLYNELIGAYVSIYPVGDDEVVVELEYQDLDNDDEPVQVKRFSLRVVEN